MDWFVVDLAAYETVHIAIDDLDLSDGVDLDAEVYTASNERFHFLGDPAGLDVDPWFRGTGWAQDDYIVRNTTGSATQLYLMASQASFDCGEYSVVVEYP